MSATVRGVTSMRAPPLSGSGRSSLAHSRIAAARDVAHADRLAARRRPGTRRSSAMLRMLPPVRLEAAPARRRRAPRSGVCAGNDAAPDLRALGRVREREAHDEADPAQERAVDRVLGVRRQDREAAVGLHALEQVADLDVRVAVVAVLDLAALAEQRVGLVEEQDRPAGLGRVEHAAQVLLGLADVLRDDLAEVDPVEVEVELARRAPRRPSSCRCRSRPRTAR